MYKITGFVKYFKAIQNPSTVGIIYHYLCTSLMITSLLRPLSSRALATHPYSSGETRRCASPSTTLVAFQTSIYKKKGFNLRV